MLTDKRDIVFIGPPGYEGNIRYVACHECSGKHEYHGTVRHPCQTCNGSGIVAVPVIRGESQHRRCNDGRA